jgi:hypothetical protein
MAPFDIFHATTNQKHVGVMEGGWDRPNDHARTLGECDGTKKALAEGNDDNDDKYGKDGDISDEDDEYTIGVDCVDKPLDKGNNECGPESQRSSVPSR